MPANRVDVGALACNRSASEVPAPSVREDRVVLNDQDTTLRSGTAATPRR
jgi:hypothetical protein